MKRILLLIAASLVFFTSNAQSDYYKRKADGYLRKAEYYQKKAEGYRREANYYLNKAAGYEEEAAYY